MILALMYLMFTLTDLVENNLFHHLILVGIDLLIIAVWRLRR